MNQLFIIKDRRTGQFSIAENSREEGIDLETITPWGDSHAYVMALAADLERPVPVQPETIPPRAHSPQPHA